MSATFPDLDKAKKLAREVLEANLVTKAPIVAETLVSPYGLNVRHSFFKEEYRNIAGFIDSKNRVIVVNADDPHRQRNFTIAHELGHYLLGHDLHGEEYTFLPRNHADQKNTCIEQEANYFASHLLVPTFLLQKYLDEYPIARDDLLSGVFGVPVEIIQYRKAYL
jgi:Zn-dependent peptidase ImmA (M78 family)